MSKLLKLISFCAMVTVFSPAVFADYYFDSSNYPVEPNMKITAENSPEVQYAHTKNRFYFYAGYVYTYRFLNGVTQSVVSIQPSPVTATYPVNKNNTPSSFHGMTVGIGKALSDHVDVQVAYLQDFKEKKQFTAADSGGIGSSGRNEISMKGFLADVLYIFNPHSRMRVGIKGGVTVADFDEKIVTPTASWRPLDNTTEVNPNMGLDLVLQMAKHVALRVDGLYTFSAYRNFYDGDIAVMAGLSINT